MHDSVQTNITHLYERFEGAGLPEELRDRFDFDLELDLQNYNDVRITRFLNSGSPVIEVTSF
jgi:hypothetical protein